MARGGDQHSFGCVGRKRGRQEDAALRFPETEQAKASQLAASEPLRNHHPALRSHSIQDHDRTQSNHSFTQNHYSVQQRVDLNEEKLRRYFKYWLELTSEMIDKEHLGYRR